MLVFGGSGLGVQVVNEHWWAGGRELERLLQQEFSHRSYISPAANDINRRLRSYPLQ